MVLTRLFKTLDDELDSPIIVMLQRMFYAWLAAAGLYLLVFTWVPIEAVEKALGPLWATAWMWCCVLGPLLWEAGRRMRSRLPEAAMRAELVADGVIVGVLLTYVASLFYTTKFGQGVFSPFIASGVACCIGMLFVRDMRRIVTFERRVRR